MRRMVLAGLFLVFTALPEIGVAAALAQDWLTPNLEAQRYNNLRRHQQRLRARPAPRQSARPGMSPQRQAELRRQIEPEYWRRVRRDGKARADAWLKRIAFQLGFQEGRKARLREKGY